MNSVWQSWYLYPTWGQCGHALHVFWRGRNPRAPPNLSPPCILLLQFQLVNVTDKTKCWDILIHTEIFLFDKKKAKPYFTVLFTQSLTSTKNFLTLHFFFFFYRECLCSRETHQWPSACSRRKPHCNLWLLWVTSLRRVNFPLHRVVVGPKGRGRLGPTFYYVILMECEHRVCQDFPLKPCFI